jgi:Zn-dependent peptidase ImmA (M78 family)
MSKTLKDLNIKNEVVVFNRKYSISFTENPTLSNILEGEELLCSAVIDPELQEIQISSSIHPESQLFSLFHEMAHIAFKQVVVKDRITLENACDAVANLMYDFCHNFKVVKK